jgi:diacylglycerol kinase
MFGLKHAMNGLVELIKNERNARFHLVSTALVIYVGVKVGFEASEWLWISLAVAGVWVAELLNTSLERITDLVSPEQNELAKKAKDYAAGAVLVMAIWAVIVFLLVAIPRILLNLML